MSWSIKGTYFESCNCETACPCLFLSPPTTGECTALVGWAIADGRDEGVSLAGLNVALAVQSQGHMATTPWTVAVYLDARADEAQSASLLKIFSGQAGGHPARLATHIGAVLGVRSVPIDYRIEDGRHALKIPEIADVEIERLEGQGGGPVTISGHPLCIAPGHDAVVARSRRNVFSDHGLAWNLSEKTGSFSPFDYQSEQ